MARALLAVAAVLVASLTACGAENAPATDATPHSAAPTSRPPRTATPTSSPSPRRPDLSGRPVLGAVPPKWLGTRVLPKDAAGFGEVRRTPTELVERRFTLPDRLPPLPGEGWASRVTSPPPARVLARSTWTAACPVAASDLAWVRLTFRGFDGRRHTGELLLAASAAEEVTRVFRDLYRARFPIEEMRITRRDELDAPPTGDGNNTGAFACRATRGSSTYSQHAFGLAVDVNPFQNPYRKGKLVLPELASSYLDRGWRRPGMISAGGPVVRAFAGIGWTWGGTWTSLKDYQHFSANGR